MLGLEYGIVRLVPHEPGWSQAFLDERGRLADALSDVQCEIAHVGSTAVAGLIAKPILDIAVGLAPHSSAEQVVSILRAVGYSYEGDAGDEGGHVLVRESQPLIRTHHLHVVDLDGRQWRSYLLLRSLLRRDEKARDAYAAEKARLSKLHAGDRAAYTSAKDAIVGRLLAEAERRHT